MRESFLTLFSIVIIFGQVSMMGPNLELSGNPEDFKMSDLPFREPIIENANRLLTNPSPSFTANRDQLENDDVRFYVQGGGIWFTDDGVWIEVSEYVEIGSQGSEISGQGDFDPQKRFDLMEPCQYNRVILKQEFVDANLVQPVGKERLSWNSNFFYGNDSSKWCTEVPNYREVLYENLYDGIDLRYYSNEKGLKYDFIVHPGANVQDIKIKYENAQITSDDDNLYLETSIGTVTDGELYVYQIIENKKVTVESKISVKDGIVQYNIKHDVNHTLIIDPLIYSTFIGGTKRDDCFSITVDSSQNAYVTGMTRSSNFPNTTGAFNNSKKGNFDVFVSKLNKNGSSLIFSTYIGGSRADLGQDIAIDSSRNIFVTGETKSLNFPITFSGNDTSYNGNIDVFILKLNYNGSDLNYSTFVGGADDDIGTGIGVDSEGNAFVIGKTRSTNFPTTKGAFQESLSKKVDCFIVKLNQSGSSLIYSTFVGGASDDNGYGIAVDSSGNVTITGTTNSSNFPTTPGAFDRAHGGYLDIFVFKLNQNGSGPIYSTFIGGSGFDSAYSIVLTSDGNAIITGHTSSSTFPNTTGAFDQSYNGDGDAYVLELNQNGSKVIFSTFMGGTKPEAALDIELDFNENIYLTGTTQSKDFPLTQDALDSSYDLLDAFAIKLNSNASMLLYSSFLGGNDTEYNQKVAVDLKGNMYLSGSTNSANFTNTTGAYDITHNGESDGYVTKLSFNKTLKIQSVKLLMNTVPTNMIYSRLCPYTYRVQIFDPSRVMHLGTVTLSLNPNGTNIQLHWNCSTGHFSKRNDSNNYVYLDRSNSSYQYLSGMWIIDFKVIVNWTYPDENFNDVQVYANNTIISPAWLNLTGFYRVENDLIFKGALSVRDEDKRKLSNGELVRGSEVLNWAGLIPIYENTTDIHPPDDEFNITIWDESGNYLEDSPAAGASFTLKTLTPPNTNTFGYSYKINLSGIPSECDATNETFKIKIDGDNVTFSEPNPDDTTWQTTSDVKAGVTITDLGGGFVDGGSVMRAVSPDNGTSWNEWKVVFNLDTAKTIKAHDVIYFDDGTDNMIKWRALDTLGNGPAESESYRILVDTQNVTFSNARPLVSNVSLIEKVEVGITISDLISGVNSLSVEYSTSIDKGITWSYWELVSGLTDGMSIDIKLNLTFPNGTANRIKWRAMDNAGNGPKESDIYIIKINTWQNKFLPKVKLRSPEDRITVSTSNLELSWFLVDMDFSNVTYNVLLYTVNPPLDIREYNLTNTSFIINNLSNGQTYYWTVIPKVGIDTGFCLSGVWSFNIDIPIPMVRLISPANNSTVNTLIPTLSWSVIYDGNGLVSYNVYLGTDKDPGVVTEGYSITHYYPPFLLEDGQTYFWKIIPIAGGITGPASDIWSFSVEAIHTPIFNLRLEIIPPMVELKPGENTTAKARVTNLGEFNDTITFSIEVPGGAGIVAGIIGPTSMSAESKETVEFLIEILVLPGTQKGDIVIPAEAMSEKANDYGLEVRRNSALTVKVIKVTAEEVRNEPLEKGEASLFIQIVIIIFIVIIIAIFLSFMINRKKKKGDVEQNKDITPTPQPESVTTGPKTPFVKPLPKTTKATVAIPVAKPVQHPISKNIQVPAPESRPFARPISQTTQPTQLPTQPTVTNIISNTGKQ